ncbi:MAG TPA: hypothetical protein VF770_08155 [Solirubrobacterales bacterium]
MRHIRKRLTYANVMSSIAVFLVLGGAAFAATQLPKNSVGTKQLKKNAVIGSKVKNGSLTGADINLSSLGAVPSATNATNATNAGHATTADNLTPLPSGQSESGMFSAGGANSAGAGGWIGAGITYARPLSTPIKDEHIIDAEGAGPVPHCSGPGHADPGYLCLYDEINSGVEAGYGYSGSEFGASFSSPSVGAVLYWPVTGSTPYSGGEYTVTAP